jgi:hypothetical protein
MSISVPPKISAAKLRARLLRQPYAWLSERYRAHLLTHIAVDAVAQREHPLRRVAGERQYQEWLGRWRRARARASTPTLWQDLRGQWSLMAGEWLQRPSLASQRQICERYQRVLATAITATP